MGVGLKGADADTLELPASDFTSIADMVRHTRDIGGTGAFIAGPVTDDAVRLGGVSTADHVRHTHDVRLHAETGIGPETNALRFHPYDNACLFKYGALSPEAKALSPALCCQFPPILSWNRPIER